MRQNFWCPTCNHPSLETKYDESGNEIMVCVNCKSHFFKNSVNGFLEIIDNANRIILDNKPPMAGLA
jgi:transcription elongation factor Elf1